GFFSKDEILAAAYGQGASQPIYYVYWALGVVAAFLTAFYMMRLLAMTFLGDNRTGVVEREHLHEAPAVMTGPLVILVLFAAIGGVTTLPAFAGGHEGLERWLKPVLEPAEAHLKVRMPEGTAELALIGAAVAIALLGLWLGYRTTVAKPIPAAKDAPEDVGFAKVLYHKYYIDEIYQSLIVRPLVATSRFFLWRFFVQGVIDGAAVNGSAGLARGIGWLGSRLQSGQLGLYVIVFVIGAVWLINAVNR